jgi:hypothetical protein
MGLAETDARLSSAGRFLQSAFGLRRNDSGVEPEALRFPLGIPPCLCRHHLLTIGHSGNCGRSLPYEAARLETAMRVYDKADKWIISNCWLACFDILGFRNLISVDEDDSKAYSVRVDYEETVENLEKSCTQYEEGYLDYCWFSDTFLMFTPDVSARSYDVIQFAAK